MQHRQMVISSEIQVQAGSRGILEDLLRRADLAGPQRNGRLSAGRSWDQP